MDDDITEVEQDPLPLVATFATDRLKVTFRVDSLLDIFGQGLNMSAAGAGGDDEDIGEDKQFGDIDEHNVLTLLGKDGIGGQSPKLVTALYDDDSSTVVSPTISSDSTSVYRFCSMM